MRLFFISEAARELGVCVATLRRLEREGKIPEAKRLMNSRRVYTEQDLERLKEILVPGLSKQPA